MKVALSPLIEAMDLVGDGNARHKQPLYRPNSDQVAVQAGQPVEFRNSDPLLHNIRANSKQGQSFNIAQPVKGMKQVRKFSKPEIGIQLRCDVHWWMAGYLHVLPHPFFAITGDDGTFTIKGVPAGTYRLEAWHEKLGTQTKTVTVKPGETVTVDFTFSAR